MDITEIFYLTATIVLVLVGVVTVYVAYQVYKITLLIKLFSTKIKAGLSLVNTAKYTAKSAILRRIINMLGGKGGDGYEE